MKPTSTPSNNPLSFEVIHQTLQEVGDFFAWIIRDPLRPGVGLTIVPVICLFLSAFLQGAAFALVVGFISLSTTDWKITGADIQSNLPDILTNILGVSNDTLIDLTPTPAVIASIITVFASVYLVHAALATFGNSRLIDLGYTYHSRCAQRLIIDNRLKLDSGAPVVTGFLAQATGLPVLFLLAAMVCALVMLLVPRQDIFSMTP